MAPMNEPDLRASDCLRKAFPQRASSGRAMRIALPCSGWGWETAGPCVLICAESLSGPCRSKHLGHIGAVAVRPKTMYCSGVQYILGHDTSFAAREARHPALVARRPMGGSARSGA